MKLQTKIQLFSSLFMLVLVISVNAAVYFLYYQISVQSEEEELNMQTNRIAATLSANPDIAAKDLLQAFVPEKGMIRVYDEQDDSPLLTLTKQADFRFIPGEFSPNEMSEKITKKGQPIMLIRNKPVIWENGEVASIQVSTQLDVLAETMRTLFYVLIIASVVMVVPTIIAGRLLSKFLLQPIQALITAMEKNKQADNWEKIHIKNRSKDELHQMEETFNEMIDELKSHYDKQEVFVSDASHELKTPISIIKSYAQLLSRRGQTRREIFEESVQAIETEADRMQKLVEQMLLLAKHEQTDIHEVVDIVPILKDAVQTFQGAYDRDIVVSIDASSSFVRGNEDQLEQIIYILIDNALIYSEEKISITVTQTATDVQIHVQDFGPGIVEQDIERIFDRFYRVDQARHREDGGTGLGLSIAREIARTHGGDITVQSEVQVGSTFTLRIPILKEM